MHLTKITLVVYKDSGIKTFGKLTKYLGRNSLSKFLKRNSHGLGYSEDLLTLKNL